MSASVDQKFETFVEETLEEKAPTDGAGAADPMQKLILLLLKILL